MTSVEVLPFDPENPAAVVRSTRWRSALAVFGGLLATFVVTTLVDASLHATGVFPPVGQRMSDALFALALAYRLPLNTAGCYLAMRLSPRRPEAHAVALGLVGACLAMAGAIAMWDFGPAWYSLANIAAALPCTWAAIRLHRLGPARC